MLAWNTAQVASLIVADVGERELESRDVAHFAAEAHQLLGDFVRHRDLLADGERLAGEEIGERIGAAERLHVECDDFVFVERRNFAGFVGDQQRFAIAADAIGLALDRLRARASIRRVCLRRCRRRFPWRLRT